MLMMMMNVLQFPLGKLSLLTIPVDPTFSNTYFSQQIKYKYFLAYFAHSLRGRITSNQSKIVKPRFWLMSSNYL
jgi:hypothetical protein